MSRRNQGSGRSSKKRRQARKGAGAAPDAVVVRAVKTARGRAATTVHVELEPERVAGPDAPDEIEEVVAELPTVDDGGESVRWDEQRLARTGDETRPGGARRVRYAATRYEGSDASRFGIKVRVKTRAGTVTRDGIRVREEGTPEDPRE